MTSEIVAAQRDTGIEVRRPLRPSEKWYWLADQVSPVTGLARVRIHGHLADGLLERAAAALAAEHPLLRVSIAADPAGRRPEFVAPTGDPEVRRVSGDDDEWVRQVEDFELCTPLDWRNGRLFRVVDVAVAGPEEVHDVLLVLSHIIADGVTALALLHGLVEHAHQIATGSEQVASRAAVPAPEDLLPARFRGVRGFATFAATSLADQVVAAVARPRRLAAETSVSQPQRRTRLLRRTLDADQLEALARRCRVAGVTVHGVLAAATAMAVGPTAAQRESGRIWIGSPVNIRGELQPAVAVTDVGAYVAMSPAVLAFGGGRDLWSIAGRANRSAARRTRFGQHLALVNAMRFLCPPSTAKSARTFRLMDRYGPGNVCVSNMGRYPFPEQLGEWRLSGAQLAVNISISGYFVVLVNTCHDELYLNFLYVEDVVSERTAVQFADGCVQAVLDAIVVGGVGPG